MAARIGNEHDLPACLAVRTRWRAEFAARVPAGQMWCPAGVPVPRLEIEELVRDHLLPSAAERWAVVHEDHGEVRGYLLCESDRARKRMTIACQGPRVAEEGELDPVGSALLSFARHEGSRRGLARVEVFMHGPSAGIAPLVALYTRAGFSTPSTAPRLEMVRPQSLPISEARPVSLRTAPEVGMNSFLAADAATRGCSVEEARENLDLSRSMWVVDPRVDWTLAYQDGSVVGIVETAVTKRGVGVIDHLQVLEAYHGRGYGRALLAHGLARLQSRCEHVWLDTDRDNAPARRLCAWAGFVVHHEHGTLTKESAT